MKLLMDERMAIEDRVPSLSLGTDEVLQRREPPSQWEIDVKALISSKKWLSTYGLRKNGLDLHHVLPSLGFKHADDYDFSLRRPISSRYSEKLYSRAFRTDGRTFNITCSQGKLHQIEQRLQEAIELYKRRLQWLTTGSRRIFGVIEETSVVIVLDICNLSPEMFDQYRVAMETVIREQLTQIRHFNIIRSTEDMSRFHDQCVPVSHDMIEHAVRWLWSLDRLAPVTPTSACEAVQFALSDKTAGAVYLCTEGNSILGSKLLLEKVEQMRKDTSPCPQLHIVSYNCSDTAAITFLKHLTRQSHGRFHAYAVLFEVDMYNTPVPSPSNMLENGGTRCIFGGIPAGAGVRDDVIVLFEELEEAKNAFRKIRELIEKQLPNCQNSVVAPSWIDSTRSQISIASQNEENMTSADWLQLHGINAHKLDLQHVLANVSFRHRDTVEDILRKSLDDGHSDAVVEEKVIAAKYCDDFPSIQWRNGKITHVQVTTEVYRKYTQNMQRLLDKIQQRMSWLHRGSRELFGTVLENSIYLLIDTSSSMAPHLQFVKDKIQVLLKEQLCHKSKLNIVSFDSRVMMWNGSMVDINERSLENAWSWVQSLVCHGTTNTYMALKTALADPKTEAVYLLTDGRPDQPAKTILAQVEMQKRVPIHTISFNCDDESANSFLSDLAVISGGRFHYYNEGDHDEDDMAPKQWEPSPGLPLANDQDSIAHSECSLGTAVSMSEDIRTLKDEMITGHKYIEVMNKLWNHCRIADGNREKCLIQIDGDLEVKTSPRPAPRARPRSAVPQPRPTHISPRQSDFSPRMTGASTPDLMSTSSRCSLPVTSREKQQRNMMRPKSAHGSRSTRRSQDELTRSMPQLHVTTRPLTAVHTRTSLLRHLNSTGQFSQDSPLQPDTSRLTAHKPKPVTHVLPADQTRRVKEKTKRKSTRSSPLSSKQWLSRHGLKAKKLTILDALSPTLVPHTATFVPVLNKHVLAKVFDEILPLAHVSGKDKTKIQLIHPNGVDLNAYEQRLKTAIKLYNRRLDQRVWDNLPQTVKDGFTIENTDIPSYLANRKQFLSSLAENNWPITEQDITLLEQEICKGLKYLQQSEQLRKVSAQKGALNEDVETAVDVNLVSLDNLAESLELLTS